MISSDIPSQQSLILLELHRHTPEFNMRNLCETLCILQGEKPVMRLVAAASAVPNIRRTLSGIGIHTAVSSWRLNTSYKTSLGDSYTVNAPRQGDQNELLVVMASLDRSLAEQCLGCEENGSVPGELGELLGYPKCCVEAYETISADNDWLAAILANSPLNLSYHYGANRLSYLFFERSLFYDYFPCSLDCQPTQLITQKVRQVLSNHGMTLFAESIKNEMLAPILLRGGILVYLRGARWEDGRLVYDLSLASLHGWKVHHEADHDSIWNSNNLVRCQGTLDFFRDDSWLGSCSENLLDNRLLIFQGDGHE